MLILALVIWVHYVATTLARREVVSIVEFNIAIASASSSPTTKTATTSSLSSNERSYMVKPVAPLTAIAAVARMESISGVVEPTWMLIVVSAVRGPSS